MFIFVFEMSKEGETKPDVLSAFSAVDKIPPFWKRDPELWFCQIEAIFSRANITNSLTKFHTIVPKIDFEILQQASDLVKRPSETPYEDLKERLVGVYAHSESKRIQQLLEGKQLGDEKPSQLLRQMKQLAGGTVADGILKTLWLRALPQNMQAILMSTDHTEISKLAEVADKIQEVWQPSDICSIGDRKSGSDSDATIRSLQAQIEQLSKQIASLSAGNSRGRSGSRGSQGSRSRSRSRRRPNPNNPNWLCFYHYKFKEKANKCEKPCAWEQKGSQPAGN